MFLYCFLIWSSWNIHVKMSHEVMLLSYMRYFLSLLPPCMYNVYFNNNDHVESWSTLCFFPLARKQCCSRSKSFQDGLMLGTACVQGVHLFSLVYFSHSLLASSSAWRCSCCVSCYAMTIGVLGLILWFRDIWWLRLRCFYGDDGWCLDVHILYGDAYYTCMIASCWHIVAATRGVWLDILL